MALYRISFSIPIGVVPLTVNDIQGIRSNWLRKMHYGYRRTRQLRIAFRCRDGPWQREQLRRRRLFSFGEKTANANSWSFASPSASGPRASVLIKLQVSASRSRTTRSQAHPVA